MKDTVPHCNKGFGQLFTNTITMKSSGKSHECWLYAPQSRSQGTHICCPLMCPTLCRRCSAIREVTLNITSLSFTTMSFPLIMSELSSFKMCKHFWDPLFIAADRCFLRLTWLLILARGTLFMEKVFMVSTWSCQKVLSKKVGILRTDANLCTPLCAKAAKFVLVRPSKPEISSHQQTLQLLINNLECFDTNFVRFFPSISNPGNSTMFTLILASQSSRFLGLHA